MRIVAPIAVWLALLCGCSSSPSAQVTISGTLAWTGGVPNRTGAPYNVIPGTVTLRGGTATVTVSADANGRFSARVARGTYVVTGKSPKFTVNGVQVTCTVAAGSVDATRDRAGIVVLCQVR
jgi:hypothetical protein